MNNSNKTLRLLQLSGHLANPKLTAAHNSNVPTNRLRALLKQMSCSLLTGDNEDVVRACALVTLECASALQPATGRLFSPSNPRRQQRGGGGGGGGGKLLSREICSFRQIRRLHGNPDVRRRCCRLVCCFDRSADDVIIILV